MDDGSADIDCSTCLRIKLATTLVHKGAMDIAPHAVNSFARHFSGTHRLQIHTDGTLDEGDRAVLLAAADGMEVTVVTPGGRKEALEHPLHGYPASPALLSRGGYFCKLELPIVVPKPFFYFDSDIIWLRPVESFAPPIQPNAFSTESWTWYHGVANDREWTSERIPRRVNSGFYYLTGEFPHERLERMMKDRLFDPEKPYNTDQEIMAFLYPAMEYYHPEDLKRSRRGVIYDFDSEAAAALHFPGRMWQPHLDQIERRASHPTTAPMNLRFQHAVPLSHSELLRMRTTLAVARSPALRAPVELYRTARRWISS